MTIVSFVAGVVVGVVYHAFLQKYVTAGLAAVRKFLTGDAQA